MNKKVHGTETEEITHESFGMVRFSRVSGGNDKFFGSDVHHNSHIVLEVYRGKLTRNLTNEYFSIEEHIPLLSLRLTTAQFAELITNMNVGYGVPCTLTSLNKKQIERVPEEIEHKKDFIQRTFREKMIQFTESFVKESQEAKELINKKTLSKEDKSRLSWAFDKVVQELQKNVPFFLECFQESSDKLSLEAKQEVENFLTAKIMQLGLQKLEDLKLLKDQ